MNRSPNWQRLLILGLSGPIVALNIWLLTQVYRYFEHPITLLIIAAVLAFLLNYPVRWLERVRLSRTQAVSIVLLHTIALLIVLGLTLVPVVIDQTTQLVEKMPAWLDSSRQNLESLDRWARSRNLFIDLQGLSSRLNTQIESQIQTIAGQAVGLALGTLGGLVDSILVLVLAFYMLLYGDRLWNGLTNLLPAYISQPLKESLRLNFHNFFFSQILLALFMAAAVIPIFLFLQVPFALLFAVVIGIAELIPFIGATIGIGIVSILVMLQNVGLGIQVAIACTILQQIRDNVLGPRMLGGFTGLNPIWIFVALLMGYQIAGFLGILLAIPIAGTIKGTLDALRTSSHSSVIETTILSDPPSGDRNEQT
jgi:predicted PurR-regulated permease PerM